MSDYDKRATHDLMESHHCDGAVVCCIDFRFREAVTSFVREQLKMEKFDAPLAMAGGAKVLAQNSVERQVMTEQLKISHGLHYDSESPRPWQIVIFTHSGCGKYRINDLAREKKVQTDDIKRALSFLRGLFPEAQVRGFIANGHQEKKCDSL